jgi:hypothetical protein
MDHHGLEDYLATVLKLDGTERTEAADMIKTFG